MIPNEVFAETLMGFLQPVRNYLSDPEVTEIMINGPDQIYVERRGKLEATDARFPNTEAVLCAIRNAAQFSGKQVDEVRPILEGRLPDGSRFEAVIPPTACDGPYVAIRRFHRDVFDLNRLVQLGTLTRIAADTLAALARAKLNILVAGGTGSGKTSVLSALATCVPSHERLVLIEDTREVAIQNRHVVSLEARCADTKGHGAVSIRDLFCATLRLRPDRIVIGEIRGGEALDVIQAMVSGHGGCMSTVHAARPLDALTRLETLAMMSDVEIPLLALRLQIASGLNLLVQVARGQDGTRQLTHITEVAGFDATQNRYQLRDLFVRNYSGLDEDGRIKSEFLPTGAMPVFVTQLQQHGVELPAEFCHCAQESGRIHSAE